MQILKVQRAKDGHDNEAGAGNKPQAGIVSAAALLIGEAILSATHLRPGDGVALCIAAVLIAVGLLRGSRLAWTVSLIGGLSQIAGIGGQGAEVFGRITGLVITLLLLAPSSVRYVWKDRTAHPGGARPAGLFGSHRPRMQAPSGRWWGTVCSRIAAYAPNFRIGLWRLGVACILLFLVVVVTTVWQEDAGGTSTVLNAIAALAWTCYVMVQVVFVAVAGLAGYLRLHGSSMGKNNLSNRAEDDQPYNGP